MSFRKEIKFKLSLSEQFEIKKKLLSQGMNTIHPIRKVNSYYFDNKDYRLFDDSEEGVLPRKKVRIRWYNNEKDFRKETKISSIEGRFKHVEKLSSVKNNEVKCFLSNEADSGLLYPIMLVNYEREYLKIDNLRITFDKNINYLFSKFKSEISRSDQETVMEVKVPIECSDDYIKKFINIPTSRFSKYSRGLLYLKEIIKF